ncbi:MAG TPA: STAS domain-containing protein [Verrucomicrobiae bacterium]|nr:STAS domain-containing protein [Verrucomicrobiae bacterium]
MTHEELSIDIKPANDGHTLVFTLHGSLDIATSPSVRAAMTEASVKNHQNVVVDLRGVEFIDSTGLGALIGAHKRASESGGSLRIVGQDGPIERLLNITGLIRVLSLYRSLEDALADRDRVVSSV